MACANRILLRDAVFLWTILLSAMRSMIDCCDCNSLVAAVLSPAVIAFLTFFTALRSDDLRPALRCRVFSAWRARFRAWAEFAMKNPCLLESLKKTEHNSNSS